jgi:FkbM family methyltransferase
MSLIKDLTIATGLYRPARWVVRHMRSVERTRHQGDVSLYRSLVPDGALCFDVGANIGVKSEALLQAGARVVSFEPHPTLVSELRARCSRHAGWTLVQSALGSEAAIATLYAHEHHGESSLGRDWSGQVVATIPVPVVTLDAAIRMFGVPWFCKIDVEGWEGEVLKGLTQPIPLVSIEFHLTDKDVAKTTWCLERLRDLGMTEANLCPAESSSFHFPNWLPLGDFIKWFPGDLERSLGTDKYGDIFLRNAPLVSAAPVVPAVPK